MPWAGTSCLLQLTGSLPFPGTIKNCQNCSFSWRLGGCRPLQNETEHIFPSHGLPEAHWSGRWTKTSYLLGEAYGHRSCCSRSGWRMEGYVVQISGGNDKQGFPMKQGVLTHGRVHLLLSKLQTKEDWREKVQICTGLPCGCQSECSQLGHREKRGEGYSWTHWYYSASSPGSQKS